MSKTKIKQKIYLSVHDRDVLISIIEFYLAYNQQTAIITLKDGTQDYSPEIGKLIKSLGLNKVF